MGLIAWSVVLGSALLCLPMVHLSHRLAIIVGVIGAAVLARLGPRVDAFVAEHGRQRLALAALWSVLVTVLLLRGNLQAEWGIIDDHEIVRVLGPTGKVSLAELVEEMVHHREIGSPTGSHPRYRPGYFVLRLIECYLWGEEPAWWYGARLVVFGVSLALYWLLLERWLGSVAGSLTLLAVLTYPFWRDIWCRLGPAEIYAVLGVALYLTGFVAICLSPSASTSLFGGTGGEGRDWALLTLGGFVAIGSKENFLLLLPLTWILAVWLWRRGQLDWRGITATLLLTALGMFITAVVGLSLRNSGTDIYGHPVETLGREVLLGLMLRMVWFRPETNYLLLGLIAVIGWLGYAQLEGKREPMRPILWRGMAALTLGGVVLMSQFYFYDGDWPQDNRYDFPGLVVLPMLIVVLAWMLVKMSEPWPARNLWLRTAFVAGLLALILARGYGDLRQGVRANVVRTRTFTARIDHIVERLREDDDRPVVFVSARPQDYEPIISVRRFLRNRLVVNPLYLRLENYPPEDETERPYRSLRKVLQEYSAKGDAHVSSGRTKLDEHFLPLQELPKAPVFEIDFLPRAEVRLRE